MTNSTTSNKLSLPFKDSAQLALKRLTTMDPNHNKQSKQRLGLLSVTDIRVLNNPKLFVMAFEKNPSYFEEIYAHIPQQLLDNVEFLLELYYLTKNRKCMGRIEDPVLLVRLLKININFFKNCSNDLKENTQLMLSCMNMHPVLFLSPEMPDNIKHNYIDLQFAVATINSIKTFLLCTTTSLVQTSARNNTLSINGCDNVKQLICEFVGDYPFYIIDIFHDVTQEIRDLITQISARSNYLDHSTRSVRKYTVVKSKSASATNPFKITELPRDFKYKYCLAKRRSHTCYTANRMTVRTRYYNKFVDPEGVYPSRNDKKECIRIIRRFASQCGFKII